MRKIAASVLLFGLFSLPYTANAQDNWIGARLGVNLANESFTAVPAVASSMKFSPFGGVQFEHLFDETWGVRSGLQFNQKGSKQTYDSTTGAYIGGTDNLSLSYIEIPIVAKMMFGTGDVHPYVYAGPTIGILMSASEDVDGSLTPIADVKSAANSTEVAIEFGGGIVFQGGVNSRVFFDAGYSAGLTGAFKSDPRANPSYVDLSTAKSGDVRIAIGMLWGL